MSTLSIAKYVFVAVITVLIHYHFRRVVRLATSLSLFVAKLLVSFLCALSLLFTYKAVSILSAFDVDDLKAAWINRRRHVSG